jgi:hypothetical protein
MMSLVIQEVADHINWDAAPRRLQAVLALERSLLEILEQACEEPGVKGKGAGQQRPGRTKLLEDTPPPVFE